MLIKIPEKIKKENLPLLGIDTNDIRQTIQAHDSLERFQHIGLRLDFAMKMRQDAHVLVMSRLQGQEQTVDEVFLIKNEFLKRKKTTNPLQILEYLVADFGLMLQVGDEKGKFFLKKAIPLPRGHLMSPSSIRVLNPSKKFWLSQYIQPQQGRGFVVLQIAIAFCLNISKYANWISN